MRKLLLAVLLLLIPGLTFAGSQQIRTVIGMCKGSSGPTCTGSSSFIRGGSSTGSNEAFEYGTGDTCNSDWTVSGSTGVNTYSTTQYQSGTHSLAITDDTSTTPSYLRADHGSVQTTQYYRMYVYVPDLANYQTFTFFGISKYDSAVASDVKIASGTSTELIQVRSNTSERIDVTGLGWIRVEIYVNDSDGSGAGYPAITVKAYNSSGTAIATTNGGGDYEITDNAAYDAYRYVWLQPEHSNSTSATVYVDNVKNCNTWCGAE